MEEVEDIIRKIKDNGLYPEINVVEEGVSSSPEFIADGKKLLSFCSFNYLGLSNDEEIKKSINEGFNKYGIHPSCSVLVAGTLKIHRELEKKVAEFLGKEDAMIFATTTMANIGSIPAIINLPLMGLLSSFKIPSIEWSDLVIFSDEINHATIVEGCRLSKAKRVIYEHCNTEDLKEKLKEHHKKKRKIIITDGVFSMDGDIAPLPDIVKLAQEYNADMFVDDVNAIGVLGDRGKGTADHFGVTDNIDIIVTGFSKAFGIPGGVVVAKKEVIDYLRVTAKTYIFSGAFLGGFAQGVLKSLEVSQDEEERRIKLWENTSYLKENLQSIGFNTLNSETPIIPILIGDEKIAIKFTKDLFDSGIISPTIRWPAVPHSQARLRFVVTSLHSKDQLNRLIKTLKIIGSKYKIIR